METRPLDPAPAMAQRSTMMPSDVTIDRAGRIVIPKPIRDRLRLAPGTKLHLSVDEEGLRLAVRAPEPSRIELDGLLLVGFPEGMVEDLPSDAWSPRRHREERVTHLIDLARRP